MTYRHDPFGEEPLRKSGAVSFNKRLAVITHGDGGENAGQRVGWVDDRGYSEGESLAMEEPNKAFAHFQRDDSDVVMVDMHRSSYVTPVAATAHGTHLVHSSMVDMRQVSEYDKQREKMMEAGIDNYSTSDAYTYSMGEGSSSLNTATTETDPSAFDSQGYIYGDESSYTNSSSSSSMVDTLKGIVVGPSPSSRVRSVFSPQPSVNTRVSNVSTITDSKMSAQASLSDYTYDVSTVTPDISDSDRYEEQHQHQPAVPWSMKPIQKRIVTTHRQNQTRNSYVDPLYADDTTSASLVSTDLTSVTDILEREVQTFFTQKRAQPQLNPTHNINVLDTRLVRAQLDPSITDAETASTSVSAMEFLEREVNSFFNSGPDKTNPQTAKDDAEAEQNRHGRKSHHRADSEITKDTGTSSDASTMDRFLEREVDSFFGGDLGKLNSTSDGDVKAGRESQRPPSLSDASTAGDRTESTDASVFLEREVESFFNDDREASRDCTKLGDDKVLETITKKYMAAPSEPSVTDASTMGNSKQTSSTNSSAMDNFLNEEVESFFSESQPPSRNQGAIGESTNGKHDKATEKVAATDQSATIEGESSSGRDTTSTGMSSQMVESFLEEEVESFFSPNAVESHKSDDAQIKLPNKNGRRDDETTVVSSNMSSAVSILMHHVIRDNTNNKSKIALPNNNKSNNINSSSRFHKDKKTAFFNSGEESSASTGSTWRDGHLSDRSPVDEEFLRTAAARMPRSPPFLKKKPNFFYSGDESSSSSDSMWKVNDGILDSGDDGGTLAGSLYGTRGPLSMDPTRQGDFTASNNQSRSVNVTVNEDEHDNNKEDLETGSQYSQDFIFDKNSGDQLTSTPPRHIPQQLRVQQHQQHHRSHLSSTESNTSSKKIHDSPLPNPSEVISKFENNPGYLKKGRVQQKNKEEFLKPSEIRNMFENKPNKVRVRGGKQGVQNNNNSPNNGRGLVFLSI